MTGDERVSVVCTGRGAHGRLTLAELAVTEDGAVTEVTTRTAAHRGGTTEDGDTVTNRAVVPAESCREDHDGRVRWRFTCTGRACRVDRPMSHETLTRAVRGLLAADTPTLDVSRLPR